MPDGTIQAIQPSHDNFFIIPNIIDEMGLSLTEFRLYCHIRRRAGEGGACYEGVRKMATACEMNKGTVVDAKKSLVKKDLIKIVEKKDKNGYRHDITIVDIWLDNHMKYNKERTESGYGGVRSSRTGGVRLEGTEEDPLEEEPIKKNKNKSEQGSMRDPLLDHPTILAYRDEMRLTPPIKTRKLLVDTVGDDNQALFRWKVLMKVWLARGFKPTNIFGLCDAFSTGSMDKDITRMRDMTVGKPHASDAPEPPRRPPDEIEDRMTDEERTHIEFLRDTTHKYMDMGMMQQDALEKAREEWKEQ